MKRIAGLILLVAGVSSYGQSNHRVTDYVDPLIGSGGHGHVFVGASVPYGGVQPGPQNFYKGWDWCSGYNYGDSVMIGFAHTHLNGTGIGDLGDILIMPYTGAVRTGKGTEANPATGYASRYSHEREKVRPGYYSVHLQNHDIDAELTATERAGFHRYHFPAGKQAHVIIDLKEGINDQANDTRIERVDAFTLTGYRFSKGWAKDQRIFFAVRSSVPIDSFFVYDNNTRLPGDSARGKAIKGLISFTKTPASLLLKVGISPVSVENALTNIAMEIPHWDFDKTVKEADEKWNRELSRIQVTKAGVKEKRIFYTSLYHTMIDPCVFNDHNGDYRGADKKIYRHAPFTNYSVFSLWDTYRAVHPLYTIIDPARTTDMVKSMLAIYHQQGKLPIWHLMGNETGTMVGISSLQVIAEACLKNIGGFNYEEAYKAIRATAMSDSLGVYYVKNLQPIPAELQRRSVAKALEYAVSDGSIALLAEKLGYKEDAVYFQKRAKNYLLYYDSTNGFFRGRTAKGEFSTPFHPLRSKEPWAHDYAEGNAWQYLWLVPQDVNGLVSLLGGREQFINRLDQFFTLHNPDTAGTLIDLTGLIGQYSHGNEPSHHIAYLYSLVGQPRKTAEIVRRILTTMYHDQPEGVIGNDDCGQMGAWYVFSSMGLYPVFPASGNYVLGSPLIEQAVIALPGGRSFTIKAQGAGKKPYVRKVLLNGHPMQTPFLTHDQVMAGGTLEFFMSSK